MLTPSFSISQDEEHLFIKIHAPYTQLKEVEINVLESVFWFYSSPYFLRLHFPCATVDNDEPPASFDSDKGEFEVRLQKKQAGEHFPDLDLLGSRLTPKRIQHNIKPTIEIVSEDIGEVEEEEDEDEWLLNQEMPQIEQANSLLQNSSKYGFGNLTSGVFHLVKSEFKEIIDLPDPDGLPATQREEMRVEDEKLRFCPDHYLADFMEPEADEFLSYTAPWSTETVDTVKLTHKEKECLKKLGNKEFLLSKEDKTGIWLSLADIVFAYAYNHRTTLGENSVESAWTINKLSATLSWFANFSGPQGVVVSCIRRSLTFPLYRNWDLAKLVLKDTISILKLGRRKVLRCLLEVHSLFAASEPRYLLNQLYINDYCIWLQRASETKLTKFAQALEEITVSKSDIGFELEELEQAALLVQEEEETLAERVKNIQIKSSDESSSSSDSEASSSEESTLDSDDDSSSES